MNTINAIFKLIRCRQWIKNTFVLLPIFFGGSLLDTSDIISGIIAFFAFCFAASSIYCLNDIIDLEADRKHPVKCQRPSACGDVTKTQAYVLMVALFVLSMVTAWFLPHNKWQAIAVILLYWVLNVAYCIELKKHAIIDVCVIAFGFILRLLVGGFASEIVLSNWIVLMTFLLTLFLSFAKRRDDVIRMEETGEAPRKNTIRYNLTFINQAITITGTAALVCYVMYTVSPEVIDQFHSPYLYLTSIFVLVGLLRYIQLAVVDKKSGDPTKVIFHDRFIRLVVLAWGISFLILIYF
ncbi:MAG: decaprenyl-phosphate phosphoribosyltransferase [Prevotella sp.]|nr:decaprenyl-phosphate phosphoribosyltransferase [Prevotella sp.]